MKYDRISFTLKLSVYIPEIKYVESPSLIVSLMFALMTSANFSFNNTSSLLVGSTPFVKRYAP